MVSVQTSLLGVGGPAPLEVGVREAAAASTVGGAFLAGYQAALRSLVPDLPPGLVALCATEEGGAHPRAIATLLTLDGTLTGTKRFVTGGTRASLLLVLATTGQVEGRNQLVLLRVDPRAPGVRVEPGGALPFVPDVPHATVTFDGARVEPEALLPGDGWDRWVKPFRTHEDLHVHAALLAHVLALGLRAGWPRELLEEGAALLAGCRALAGRDASSPSTHLALAGLLRLGRRWLDAGRDHWPRLEETTRAGLARDLQLLDVAARARAKRTEVAWGG